MLGHSLGISLREGSMEIKSGVALLRGSFDMLRFVGLHSFNVVRGFVPVFEQSLRIDQWHR